MTKFNKCVAPKGWVYPLNKKEIKSLIIDSGAFFDKVEFEKKTNPPSLREEELGCFFGVFSSKKINGEYVFSLKLDSLKEEYVNPWKECILNLVGTEILEFFKEKINQPDNSSKKPTQLFLKYSIAKGVISSECSGVD